MSDKILFPFFFILPKKEKAQELVNCAALINSAPLHMILQNLTYESSDTKLFLFFI